MEVTKKNTLIKNTWRKTLIHKTVISRLSKQIMGIITVEIAGRERI